MLLFWLIEQLCICEVIMKLLDCFLIYLCSILLHFIMWCARGVWLKSIHQALFILIGWARRAHHMIICNSNDTLASKLRFSPIETISIPHLELYSCLLLFHLVYKTVLSLKMDIDQILLFSDSTIALTLINSPSHQLKSFVKNQA